MSCIRRPMSLRICIKEGCYEQDCGALVGEEKCMQNLGGGTQRKESTLKT